MLQKIIFVDDASGDDTVDVITRYAKFDERIEIIQNDKSVGAKMLKYRIEKKRSFFWNIKRVNIDVLFCCILLLVMVG